MRLSEINQCHGLIRHQYVILSRNDVFGKFYLRKGDGLRCYKKLYCKQELLMRNLAAIK